MWKFVRTPKPFVTIDSMKIYILRHGETTGNVAHLMDGATDVPLTEKGMEQARRAGDSLRDVPFTHFFTSPLSRAIRTMELAMGRVPEYRVDARLIERDCGALLGICYDDMDRHSYWSLTRNEEVFPDSESIRSVLDRVYDFLDEIKQTLPGDAVVLIAAHSGISKAVRCYFEGFPEDGDLLHWGLGNAEWRMYEL